MRKALQFGAGSIGRGFIGQLFSRSGYEVVFVDVDERLVAAMNAARRYTVRIVSDEGDAEEKVERIRAVDGRDLDAVARELVGADVAATAVGAGALPAIAPALARGLTLRWAAGVTAPLAVILCENLAGADEAFRNMVRESLGPEDRERLPRLVGFVRASVGRMVPVMTEAMREENPLLVRVEAYDRLPVDAEAFVGPPPSVFNMEPVAPFDLYVQRKLYIHNLGHAAVAYLGALEGLSYIWEAVGNERVRAAARSAMGEAAAAIAAEHGVDEGPLLEHADDLLRRFSNRALGDTIARVGRDLPRKLAPGDRILGAIALCGKHGLSRSYILEVLAAALRFDDPASTRVADLLASNGPRAVLERICGLAPDDPDFETILRRFASLGGIAAADAP
jgi:mannitol-1-phosphate 5-dehydrogenase